MTPNQIIKEICERYSIGEEDLKGKRKDAKLVRARRELAYRLRMELNLSYPKIGMIMQRDHTTIIYHVNKRLNKEQGERIANTTLP